MRQDESPVTRQRSLQLPSHNSWSNWKEAKVKHPPYMALQGRRSSWTQGMCLDAKHSLCQQEPRTAVEVGGNGSVSSTRHHLHSAWCRNGPRAASAPAHPPGQHQPNSEQSKPTSESQPWQPSRVLGPNTARSLALGIDLGPQHDFQALLIILQKVEFVLLICFL